MGLFVPQQTHKNFFTQLLGALSLLSARVHVLSLPALVNLGKDKDRVVVHGVKPHPEFLKTLGSMDANLYVTLSECYPMTVLESLRAGVPCLTSDTSPIFDDDDELRRLLIVRKLDDPSSIAQQLRLALDARVEIAGRAHALLRRLNQKADELWEAFTIG